MFKRCKNTGWGARLKAQTSNPTRLALVIFGCILALSAMLYCTYLVFAYFTAQSRLSGTKEFATLNLDIQNSNSTSIVSNSYNWSSGNLTPGDTITLQNVKVANTGDTACYALINFQLVITPVSNKTPKITYSTWYNLSGDLVHTYDLTENVTPSSSISANSSTNLTLSYTMSGADITNAYKGASAHMSLNACAIQSSYLAGVSTNLDAVSYIISNSGIVATPTTYTLTLNLGDTSEQYTLIGGSTIQASMKACGLDATYSNTETIGLFTDSDLMHTLTARDCLWGNKTLYTRIATQEYITIGTPSNGAVSITGSGSLSSESTPQDVVIPASVTVNGTTYPVTKISDNAFKDNTKITSVTIPSGVTTIGSNAFSGCTNLQSVNIPNTVTQIGNSAFMDSGLEDIDLDDAEALLAFKYQSLRNTNITSITVPESVTTIGDYAFAGCTELTTFEFEENSNLSSIGKCAFDGCSKLKSLIIPHGTSINPYCLFRGCSSLTTLDVSGTTLSGGQMTYTFGNCSQLESVDVSNWDTSNVIVMPGVFNGCSNLTRIDVSNFDTSNVTSMFYMFQGCSRLAELDLSSFDTTEATNMEGMFGNCLNLETIYVCSNFVTTNVTNSSNMFRSCDKLVGGNGTTYNSSYTDKTYARIDTAGNPGYFTLKV